MLGGDQRGLWQKDEGQVVGGQGQGGDGLVAEGQDGLESYLAWASPTWQAHSGEVNLIWDSYKTDNVVPSKFSPGHSLSAGMSLQTGKKCRPTWDQFLEDGDLS